MIHRGRVRLLLGSTADINRPKFGRAGHTPGPWVAQTGTVSCAFPGDLRCGSAGPQETAVLVVVVAAVGEQPARHVTWPSPHPADAGYPVQQRHQLGDIVLIRAGTCGIQLTQQRQCLVAHRVLDQWEPARPRGPEVHVRARTPQPRCRVGVRPSSAPPAAGSWSVGRLGPKWVPLPAERGRGGAPSAQVRCPTR
jgi:hypothetical protein